MFTFPDMKNLFCNKKQLCKVVDVGFNKKIRKVLFQTVKMTKQQNATK